MVVTRALGMKACVIAMAQQFRGKYAGNGLPSNTHTVTKCSRWHFHMGLLFLFFFIQSRLALNC